MIKLSERPKDCLIDHLKSGVLPKHLFKRRGTFLVSELLAKSKPWEIMKIMSQFLVVRAEHHYVEGCFEYTAYSLCFDAVEQFETTPFYDVSMSDDGKLRAVRRLERV